MHLTDFLIFCLSSSGATLILVSSEIAAPVRSMLERSIWLGKLINCAQCTGVWVGAVMSFYFVINPIIAASITSVLSWSIHNLVDAANSIAVNLDDKTEEEE